MNSILAIVYAFSLAYCPTYNIDDFRGHNDTIVSSKFGVDLFEHCTVYGGFCSKQQAKEWNNHKPFVQQYSIGAEGHFEFNDMFNLNFGVMHECSHPVVSWNKSLTNYNDSHTEFYVGVNGKVDVLFH